ncbi:10807_t:CDS:1, partial [Scutellospora calospora]
YEKARIENGYIDTAEQLERQSQEYLKDIELAKYHEERGKINCECYACEEKKALREEIKAKIKKEIDNYDCENKATEKEECPECGKMKELAEETGA